MSYIKREKLLKKVGELESLASKRVYDTPTNSPAYQRYSTQMIERASFIDVIKEQPIADVVEVRHGEWMVDAYKGDEIVRIPYKVHEHDEPYCSVCGTYALLDGKEDYAASNFCPNCGAKMDGERRANDGT